MTEAEALKLLEQHNIAPDVDDSRTLVEIAVGLGLGKTVTIDSVPACPNTVEY